MTQSNRTSGGPSNCAGCRLTENVTRMVGLTLSASPLIGRSCNGSLLARLRGDAGASAYRLRQITPGRLIRKCPAHVARTRSASWASVNAPAKSGMTVRDGFSKRMDAGEDRMDQVEGIGRRKDTALCRAKLRPACCGGLLLHGSWHCAQDVA